jgi:hypothetical protein
MATLTSSAAGSAQPAFKAVGSGILCAAYGHVDATTSLATNDVVQLCRVPAGAVILGGFLRMEDLDSNATETIDIDVGTSADTDAFGNFGVQTGDAVTGYLPEGGVLLPLHGTLKDGPVSVSAETVVQLTVVAGAATAAAGTITCVVHYVCP